MACQSYTGSCCEAKDTPGCEDPAVVACVCAEDGYCCNVEWDETCVSEVTEYDCGVCE